MRTAQVVMVSIALVGCGESATDPDPEPIDPGPANIVVTEWSQPVGDDVTTTLDNTGGPGSYRLDFLGGYAGQPYGCHISQWPCPCRAVLVGTSETVTVDEDYEETVSWDTSDLSIDIVEAYSRDENSAAWRRTSRVKDSNCR